MCVWDINYSSPVGFLMQLHKPHKEAAILYVERPYTTCSFQVVCFKYAYNVGLKRDCNVCLEPSLAGCILHVALTQKIDISDSRAVVRYVQPHV